MVIIALLFFAFATAFGQERLYVVQGGDESLAEISLSNGAVNSHLLDLGLWCNDITVHGTRLFVANSGDNTVQEIDAATNTTVRVLPIVEGINPWAVALIGEDTIAVTCWVSRNVLLLRYSDGATIGNLTMPTGPEGILMLEDRLIVCETGVDFPNYGNGFVRIYDRGTLQLLDSVQVGVNAQSARMDPQGRLHVMCTGDYVTIQGTVHVIDLVTMTTDTILQIGGTPNMVSFGGGHAYVAAGGFGDTGYVYRYRLEDFELVNWAGNPIQVGRGATDVEARENGSFFVSCMEEDEVREYDSNGDEVDRYPVSDGPGYMVLYPGGMNSGPNEVPLPSEISLANAYPNPFNSVVFLQFSAPLKRPVYVRIVNQLGQEVDRIAVAAGVDQVSWRSPESSGTYFAISGGSAIRLLHLK